jgi:ornithine carbamoyltransferase
MKNLLKMSDLSPAELTHILDVADQLKAQQKLGGTAPLLAGKTVALIFSKASTRTRPSGTKTIMSFFLTAFATTPRSPISR